jgi:tetratricopeptide (TPR) repeat protein
MSHKHAASRIVYLNVPESLIGQFEGGGDFAIDPTIPIPAEIPSGEERLPLERLSWEMIVSGMIRVVSAKPDDERSDYYRRFITAVKPDLVMEFFNAAVIKAESGDFDIAQDIAESLAAVYPHAPLAHLALALVAEHKGDAAESEDFDEEAALSFKDAVGFYKKALAERPVEPAALFNAAYFYMKRGNFSRAASHFGEFLDWTEDYDDEIVLRQREKAENIITEINKRKHDDELFHEAYDCLRLDDTENGLNKAKLFIEQHPNVWNGWFLLGWALRKLERWEDGEKAFEKCLELGGDGEDTRKELAICLEKNGKPEEAQRLLEPYA